MTTQKRVALGLAVLVLAAAGALMWLARTGERQTGGVTTAESDRAAVASATVKADVLDIAEEAAARIYSYSWKTLADDRAEARELLTGDMLAQYDRTMAGVATSSQRDRTVVSAEVVDTAVVTATASYARVLVFVNQNTTADALKEPTLDLDRVLITLLRTRGEWKVSELDAL